MSSNLATIVYTAGISQANCTRELHERTRLVWRVEITKWLDLTGMPKFRIYSKLEVHSRDLFDLTKLDRNSLFGYKPKHWLLLSLRTKNVQI